MAPEPVRYSLNQTLAHVQQSATLAINEQSNLMVGAGKQVTRLGLGQSPFPVPPCVVDALRANASQKDYLPVLGLPALRESVADHLSKTRQLNFSSDNIVIGPGSKELLFILQLACAGELILPAPSWVSYAPQATLLGLTTTWLHTSISDGWRLRPDVLANHCQQNNGKPRILILNYPNNPAGTSYSHSELEELANVARKHNLIVVADEIYWELSFSDSPHSFAKYYPEGTIISTGLSKWCGAGGWRLGCLALPDDLVELRGALATIASETFSSVCAPVQYAAVTAFAGGQKIEQYRINCRRIMQTVLVDFAQTLRSAGISCVDADGGFYLMPDFSPFQSDLTHIGISDSSALANRLLQDTGIAALPGSVFGLPNNQLILRLALVDFDGAIALRGCEKNYSGKHLDKEFLERFTHKTYSAASQIINWLHQQCL